MRISTSRSTKLIVWASLFSIGLYLLIFNSPSSIQPVHANDLSILCFAVVTEVGPDQVADSCADVHVTFPNATVVRSTDEFPADLSPFEAIFIDGDPTINYGLLAAQVNSYVSNGGGLVLSFPSFENGTPQLPAGFEMTMTNQFWPEFPNEPSPVEFTAIGLSHPVLAGIATETLPGVFSTFPISSLGASWTLLAKAANHPNAALAVGEHGSGRIAFFVTGTEMNENGIQFAEQLFEWISGEVVTPPAGPDMQIDAIEVTQAIQDLSNSVDLIADKRTYVRVHVSASKEVETVTAQLTAERNGVTLAPLLMPVNIGGEILILPAPDRGQLTDSFLFELPISWTEAGGLTLNAEIDPENLKSDPNRPNNSDSVEVEFIPAEPLRLRLYNVRFAFNDKIYVADKIHLDLIEAWLKKAFPISTLEVKRTTINYPYGGYPNVERSIKGLILLKKYQTILLDLHPDTYYYAAVDDPRFFIQGSAAADDGVAIGPVGDPKTAAGQAWDTDETYGDWIAGHEIAHLVGRDHANCPGKELSDSVPYPYVDGKISPELTGETAFYGFDLDTQDVYGPEWVDLMSYCFPKWISNFTYEGIHADMSAGSRRQVDVARATADKFLIISADVDLDDSTVQALDVQEIEHTTTLDLPEPGDWLIVLLNSAGSELATYSFAPSTIASEEDDHSHALISEVIPWQDGVVSVEIRKGSTILATKAASPNIPTISITTPTPNQTFGQGPIEFAWTGSDADNDRLTYTILYSHTGNQEWDVLATDWVTPSIMLEPSSLPGGSASHLRILASDGFNSSAATVGPFTVPSGIPEPHILTPSADGASFSVGQLISFEGTAYDREDGSLKESALSWSSNVDGILGTGELVQSTTLSAGVHTITLTAMDSNGETGQVVRTITILNRSASAPTHLAVAPFVISLVKATGDNVVSNHPISIRNTNGADLDWTVRTDTSWIKLNSTAGTAPSNLVATVDSGELAAGPYSGSVIFESAGAENSPITVPVILEVSDTAAPTFGWNVYLPLTAR